MHNRSRIVNVQKNNANFAKRGSPCSLLTTARETLSHAHRESTPFGYPVGWPCACLCTPNRLCFRSSSVTTTDNIGALVLRPVTGQIRSQTFASARSSVLAKPPASAQRAVGKLQRALASQKQRYINPTYKLFSLVGYYWHIIYDDMLRITCAYMIITRWQY